MLKMTCNKCGEIDIIQYNLCQVCPNCLSKDIKLEEVIKK